MEYKYQIIALGSIPTNLNEIVDLFYRKVKELNLQEIFYQIITSSQIDKEYKDNQPAFVLYFGNPDSNFEDVDIVEKLLNKGNLVLPIFYDSFRKEIPAVLSNQNGLKYDEYQNDKIVNLILESFGKLRNTRKIFISYKRDESTSVAIQLYEALEKYNFDVFLDTHSIKQGEPFQDELWHRMTDCDVIVFLNTPNFLNSEWCEKEIAEASVKQIGVLQLLWPNNILASMAEICFLRQLEPEDFINKVYDDKDISKLTDLTLKSITQEVESIRARNLAARQDNLITEFLNFARKNGKKLTLQPERFITEDITHNKKRIFIPSIGIPQSMDYNQSSVLKKEIKEYSAEVFLIYDNVRIREKWLKHLEYLNEHLDVQSIKKQEFDSWLQNH